MEGFSCPAAGGPSWLEDDAGGGCCFSEPGGRDGVRVRSVRMFSRAGDTDNGSREAPAHLGIRGFMLV